jgi:RNA polymerase sigma factor (sigma-70 family)
MLSQEEIEMGAGYCTRWISNLDDREDAKQEYRIAAWRALDMTEPDRDPRPYQRVSGRNAVLAFWKKQRRASRAKVRLDWQDDSGNDLYNCIASETASPDRITIRREFEHKLRRLIDELPTSLRRITELSADGKNTREICLLIGYSRQAVNRAKLRAQKMLSVSLSANDKKSGLRRRKEITGQAA